MSASSPITSIVDAALARVLRSWDDLKASNPAVALYLAPILRRLWITAVRRRPTWAQMRDQPPWMPRESHPDRSTSGHQSSGRVDERHLVEDPAQLVAARVEHAFAVPSIGVFLVGWLFDPAGRVASLTVHAGERTSSNVLGDMIRLSRPDVGKAYVSWTRSGQDLRHGFACLVHLEGASVGEVTSSLSVVLADSGGNSWALVPRPVIADHASPLTVIRDLLTMVPPRDPAILDRHLGPAVSALWATRERSERVVDIGTLPAEPRVSIVVPVYGRYDFIEYQMALFADDPDLREAELIYVIDDPRIRDDAVRLCRELLPIFRVPCRLVLNEQNHGFARATNNGADLARAPLLLMLNSDVLPASQGWLSQLLEAYARLPGPGVIGPRLLFPDGSLQHGGMEFVQEPWLPGIWLNDHPGKGLPPGPTSRSGELEQVVAITAACMMIDTALYRRVGGLDEGYIIGDFEDSDLCLKLRELGHASYVAPWIELYHLERQSQGLDGDPDWRQSLTLYNAWRHTRKWAHVIERVEGAPSHA